jgi:ADP-heptose:LPS heptosyltransferase
MKEFYINSSNVPQIFYQDNGEPVRMENLMAIPQVFCGMDKSNLTRILTRSSIADILEKHNSFAIYRSFALGDILTMIPVIYELRKKFKIPILGSTDPKYNWCLGDWYIQRNKQNKTLIIDFDSILELDHDENHQYRYKHRVNIFLDCFGIARTNGLCWDFPPGVEISKKRIIDDNYIAVQLGGSGKFKIMNETNIQTMLDILSKKYPDKKIVLFGNREQLLPLQLDMTNKNTISIVGQLKTPEMVPFIRDAEFMICYDSAPLWISHFTKTPIICLLGPTRESERLIEHPLYPNRVIGLKLNEIIECSSCFERASCKNFDCMRVPVNKFQKYFLECLEQMGGY